MKRARDVREQLIETCKRVEVDFNDPKLSRVEDELYSNVCKCLCSGFFYNTARLQKSGGYRTLKNPHTVEIHPSSALFEVRPKWVLFHQLVLTSKEFMRDVL